MRTNGVQGPRGRGKRYRQNRWPWEYHLALEEDMWWPDLGQFQPIVIHFGPSGLSHTISRVLSSRRWCQCLWKDKHKENEYSKMMVDGKLMTRRIIQKYSKTMLSTEPRPNNNNVQEIQIKNCLPSFIRWRAVDTFSTCSWSSVSAWYNWSLADRWEDTHTPIPYATKCFTPPSSTVNFLWN